MPTKVFFMGNPLLGDDAVGSLGYKGLEEDPRLRGMQKIYCDGFDLASSVEADDEVIIVDAVQAERDIGKVSLLREEQIIQQAVLSAHDLGVAQAVRLVRTLYPQLKPIKIIGINAMVSADGKKSKKISANLDKIKEQIAKLILEET